MSKALHDTAVALLMKLIATPSFSKEEEEVSFVIEDFFSEHNVHTFRRDNNVWARNKHFDPDKPTILLNSHLDTVRPNTGYTRDPFKPGIIDGKLYGLGSNDAGGPLVSLIATFLHYHGREDLPYNLIMAATAEEEISGTNGVESVWPSLAPVTFAIVGEPTLLGMATAEKGLMVLDCVARGKPGHAARNEGINAISLAIEDINWFHNYHFENTSPTLGDVKTTVTVISAGKQHNVVPAECHFTVDVRVTDSYTLEEVLDIIKKHVKVQVSPRSMRMRPSGIDADHVLVKAATKLGIHMYGSPTTSDQALIPVPSVKMGPGDSARSHSADEFIYVDEIRKGIDAYIRLLDLVMQTQDR